MKAGLLEVLRNDPCAAADAFTPSFSREDFVGFVLDHLLALLVQGQPDCGILLEIIRREQVYVERLYPFQEAGKIQVIRKNGQLLQEEYLPDGIAVKAYVPKEIYLSGRI